MTCKWWSAKGGLATKVRAKENVSPTPWYPCVVFLFLVVLSGCLAHVCLSQLTDSSSFGSRLKLSHDFCMVAE